MLHVQGDQGVELSFHRYMNSAKHIVDRTNLYSILRMMQARPGQDALSVVSLQQYRTNTTTSDDVGVFWSAGYHTWSN